MGGGGPGGRRGPGVGAGRVKQRRRGAESLGGGGKRVLGEEEGRRGEGGAEGGGERRREEGEEEDKEKETRGAVFSKRGPNTTGWLGMKGVKTNMCSMRLMSEAENSYPGEGPDHMQLWVPQL